MTVRSTGGNANTLAVPGDYWYPRDEFVQLQLSGGPFQVKKSNA